jgi:hypothetical protein
MILLTSTETDRLDSARVAADELDLRALRAEVAVLRAAFAVATAPVSADLPHGELPASYVH